MLHIFSPRLITKIDRCNSINYNGPFLSSRKSSRKIFIVPRIKTGLTALFLLDGTYQLLQMDWVQSDGTLW